MRRTGHIPGPSGPHVPNRPLHSVEALPTTTLDASTVGPPPGAAAQLHLRTADRAAAAACRDHGDVWQGRRRARRPVGTDHPLGHPHHRGALGDPAANLRAGALPGPRPDDPGRAHAPRPVPLRVLRRAGRHRRSRDPAQPRRRALVGELRGGVRAVQPPQGRPSAGRTGLVTAVRSDAAQAGSTGGCCRPSRNSTRPGCAISARARPDASTCWALSAHRRVAADTVCA